MQESEPKELKAAEQEEEAAAVATGSTREDDHRTEADLPREQPDATAQWSIGTPSSRAYFTNDSAEWSDSSREFSSGDKSQPMTARARQLRKERLSQ